ncbi:MAG: hypothetical protein CO029_03000 [Candidatus Magasanikbacteria bacterium CG_4_9_14_0_2_um_filter_41_10]|uniref:Uncharacterized protein n=1 Tax=Candidatus Magasanikbacteria bacterium CG_4_10_14_0_2_um_filter_41_31 TaxID=1974639 RepID=A0A2M7V264_9BACT|nr:MAG: hypothetical protein AUJ37_01020 [Candidatus Magasanikbacteria bacterium CG1_02_41_34]PIZ92497.1 MAG: hypothetical protein COX83_04105 [Candidatus Magasanikbacteria bacterium CG_4_10_14_0_2_um_filter_41_31]PJC53378.1 MAG: hypothetical protein CO029_03000 [Candidatus Magasanikbacteria bacterium CG_4_9_14_0_2_um_filter_41_10]
MSRKKKRKRIQKLFRQKKSKRNRQKSMPLRWAFVGIASIIGSIVVIGLLFLILHPKAMEAIDDDRAARIDAYFAKFNMPLEGYGDVFISSADQCGMDWRLLPAIAIRESSGGKHMQYNNPFGWGGAQIPFESMGEAIMNVGSHLCGNEENTAKYYARSTVQQKLYRYNGTVIASYPMEVKWIMRQF